MATYFIIGGDGKEYGPVSEADVRLWISEGRLDAGSRAKAESDAEFRPLAQFPEFATALAPATIGPVPAVTAFWERDYELDIADCISRGWGLFKENFGLLFASFLIFILIQFACGGLLNLVLGKSVLSWPVGVRLGYGFLTKVVLSLVIGPLVGGLYLVYLKTIRRQPTSVGEVFAGFQQAYLQLFLGSSVVALVVGACLLPFQFVWELKTGPLLEQMQHLQNDPTGMQKLLPQFMPALASSLPVLLICLVPVTFLTVCWMFTLPLIIDKGMDFGMAMKNSWKMVIRHWWHVFGLFIVAGLVSAAGLLGCCVGALFTAPIGMAALMIAYETIFGAEKN